MRAFLASILLTTALFLFPTGSPAQTAWADISGQWAATTYYDNSADDSTITITIDDDIVTVEATSGSSWKGSFDQKTRTLKAYYTRGEFTGKVDLRLNDRGDILEGTWTSYQGGGGRYIARRGSMTLSGISPHPSGNLPAG